MKRMARLFKTVVGDQRENWLQDRLFNLTCLFSGASNIIGSWIYLEHQQTWLFLLQLTSGVLFLFFYYLSRFRNKGRHLYWPFILLILIFLFDNILENGGMTGGAHYYLVSGLVIAVVLSGSLLQTAVSILLFVVTTMLLVYIEITYPSVIVRHASRISQVMDVSLNFLFVEIFTAALVVYIKYLSQQLNLERQKSERLLLNILPEPIAAELKTRDRVAPRNYAAASVLFTDFVGFTKIAERLTPDQLIDELDYCFRRFDEIAKCHRLERIKTIGDAYMAAGGLPEPNATHAVDCVRAALDIQRFMAETRQAKTNAGQPYWELRLGINSGPLIAGVVGRQKFAYDIWSDTVNTASRLESSGVAGKINISESTFNLVKDFFDCEFRGKIPAKGKGELNMYFVNRIRPALSGDDGRTPNDQFQLQYSKLQDVEKPSA